MNKNDGGPAFPVDGNKNHNGEYETSIGMSLRDYFAAKAMAGQLACFREFLEVEKATTREGKFEVLSNISYKIADAMLKAREAE